MSNGDGGGSNGASRYQTIFAGIVVITTILGGVVLFFTQIGGQSSDISSLKGKASNLEDSVRSLPTIAATLTNVGTRVAGIETELATIRDRQSQMLQELATLRVSLKEIETQFCANDIIRNQSQATELRFFAMLWRKSFGEDLPINNAYYPTICPRPTQ